MIKLIALDMDGTLLNNDKCISKGNFEVIQKAKKAGIKIILASGRPLQGLKGHLESLGLTSNEDFVVSYNGSLVQRVGNGEILHQTSIKGSDAKALLAISIELGVYIHAFSVTQGLITHKHNAWTDQEAKLNGITATEVDFNQLDDHEDIIKVMLVADEESLTSAIKHLPKYLKEKYTVVRSATIFLEFLHLNSNKGIAIDKLSELLHIDANEVMCMGDAENDHAMLKFAGIAVAMDNADSETKALANFITKSNIEDGVAFAIEEKALKDFEL